MCVIHCWPQLSCLTLPAGVHVSSAIFRQVGSRLQFSGPKTVMDNCSQLHFVNFRRMELLGKKKNYGNLAGPIRSSDDLILAQRGKHCVMTNYMIHWPQRSCKCDFLLRAMREASCLRQLSAWRQSDAGVGVWLLAEILSFLSLLLAIITYSASGS